MAAQKQLEERTCPKSLGSWFQMVFEERQSGPDTTEEEPPLLQPVLTQAPALGSMSTAFGSLLTGSKRALV